MALTRSELRKLFKRFVLLLLGMFTMSLGIAAVCLSDLGNTPISTLPYAVSEIAGISFGQATFAVNLVLVALQVLILRRRFKIYQLLQIPAVFVFSAFIDLSMWLLGGFVPGLYAARLAACVFGSLLLACGITMQLRAHMVMQPGEGIVQAVSIVSGIRFSTLKVANDLTLIALASAAGILFLGEVVGIREGTLVSAFLVGWFLSVIALLLQRSNTIKL